MCEPKLSIFVNQDKASVSDSNPSQPHHLIYSNSPTLASCHNWNSWYYHQCTFLNLIFSIYSSYPSCEIGYLNSLAHCFQALMRASQICGHLSLFLRKSFVIISKIISSSHWAQPTFPCQHHDLFFITIVFTWPFYSFLSHKALGAYLIKPSIFMTLFLKHKLFSNETFIKKTLFWYILYSHSYHF